MLRRCCFLKHVIQGEVEGRIKVRESGERRRKQLLDGVNPLTPNYPYRGRTAPLTSKVAFYIFIQQI